MKKKLLDCPVVGKDIKPAVCGANRISRYDCPESCPHKGVTGFPLLFKKGKISKIVQNS